MEPRLPFIPTMAVLFGLAMLPLVVVVGAQRKPMEPEERTIAVIPLRGVQPGEVETPPTTDPRTWYLYIYSSGIFELLDDAGDNHTIGVFSITDQFAASGAVQVRNSDNELADGPIDTGTQPLPVRWPQGNSSAIMGKVPVLEDDYVDQSTPHDWVMKTVPHEVFAGTVDLNVTTKQDLVTVPTGRVLVVTQVIEDEPSAAVTTAAGAYGFDANATDVISNARVNSFTGTDQYIALAPDVPAKVGAAAAVFGFKCSTPEGSARTMKVRIIAYYK